MNSTRRPRAHGAHVRARHVDSQPRDTRRHDRQQLVRRPSSRYGMTIDHVESPGRRARRRDARAARAVSRAEARAARRRGHARGARSTAACPARRPARDALRRDYPRFWRQSGGYRLERMRRRDAGRSTREGRRRLGGNARGGRRGRASSSCRAQAVASMAAGHFASIAEAIAATGDALAQRRRVGRAGGSLHPRHLPPQARVPARSAPSSRATPARCCSSSSRATTQAEVDRAASTRSSAAWRRARPRL